MGIGNFLFGQLKTTMAKKKSRDRRSGDLLKLLATRPRAVALAALHVSESVLLELEASEVLSPSEIRGLLRDASLTLRNAADHADNRSCLVASEIVESMRESFKRSKS
ncbi:hypothetical protein EB231_31090 [Mesorhizobium sp. NZP2298]|nr:hypothetical protein EB231_31090 [Mesorhizobium sp. NZP2298]